MSEPQLPSQVKLRDEVEVRVRGAGPGRESAITALQHSGIKITAIEDRITPDIIA